MCSMSSLLTEFEMQLNKKRDWYKWKILLHYLTFSPDVELSPPVPYQIINNKRERIIC
jgi:hypothetical protein